ncbi:Nudix hydrolase [Quillaja saponaria]|uniref:Nudix hydrolase n=1 Tax=Quillaja saponaria TaxID=32244 RepID=A0AAD7KUS8_QUISA|nr:Nudix hydrolase [Quillaja saponaria]
MLRSLSKPSLLYLRTSINLCCLASNHSSFISLASRARRTPAKAKVEVATPVAIRSMSASISSSRGVDEVAAESVVQQVKLLTATDDDHGGVIVEMDQHMESTAFVSILRASIFHWRQLGKRGVWIKLPIHLVNLVEAAVKEGFWYHHAEPKYLILVYWIPEGANTLPANATHRVGIGAFVMNDKREVLVVQEKSGKFQGTGIWKFPTGVVDQGEDICGAAVREVKEETGIDSEFVEVLAFRQSHHTFFDKSDLFFVCMLRPLSFDIRKQELEIEAAEWMPFEEYTAQPFVQQLDLLKYMTNICLARIDGDYSGFSPVLTSSGFSEEKHYMYLNTRGLKSL